jgi:hypothetical protein
MKKQIIKLIALMFILNISLAAYSQYNYDSVSFETPTSKIIIDTTGNNIWQIGTPNKDFFNSAHTGTNAIVTDTINSYPINDTSSFIYVIRNPYTVTCYTSMEFWHKYDMDTLIDIGIIEASYDGGNSWVLVSDTSDVLPMGSYFWWDNDFHASNGNYTNHPLTTTGKSDGWILSRFNWQWWIPVKADTIIYPLDSLMIKFTFISDAIETNQEGWIIDDILTASAEWQLCSDVNETSNNNFRISPNPFSQQMIIESMEDLKGSEILLYNSTGIIVKDIHNASGKSITVQRENLPSGFYFLVITKNGKMAATNKVIIE